MNTNALAIRSDFNVLIAAVSSTVSKSSFVAYQKAYSKWQLWCDANRVEPFDLSFNHVAAYLDAQTLSKSSKQQHLAALKKLLVMQAILDPSNPYWQTALSTLKLLKIKSYSIENERQGVALGKEQVWKILNLWEGDSLLQIRNHALLCVLFYVGLRRSEAASLTWSDIDLESELIHVKHGKGDKSRSATIIGTKAVASLKRWKEAVGTREYVFPAIRKGNHLDTDKPMTSDAVWRVVKDSGEKIGVKIAPHDARRTLATNLSENSPLGDVQSQLGHENEATTLRYFKAARAKDRKSRLKLDY